MELISSVLALSIIFISVCTVISAYTKIKKYPEINEDLVTFILTEIHSLFESLIELNDNINDYNKLKSLIVEHFVAVITESEFSETIKRLATPENISNLIEPVLYHLYSSKVQKSRIYRISRLYYNEIEEYEFIETEMREIYRQISKEK